MKTLLFGNGDSGNHGCEAITRSTGLVLSLQREDYLVTTPNSIPDKRYGADSAATLYDYLCPGRISKSARAVNKLARLILGAQKNPISPHYDLKSFIPLASQCGLALSAGGDNYCYPSPFWIGTHTRAARDAGCKTVLWGCSVEPESLKNPYILSDIGDYDLICARESITACALRDAGFSNVFELPDPAFSLPAEQTALPDGFERGNTIGINLSPMLFRSSPAVYESYKNLIAYLIENTNHKLALIPHVIWEFDNDLVPLSRLFSEFSHTGRVILADADKTLNAMQLKYIISQCNTFVAARTHASIAAYSTGVPTLVVGYSVKARGLALDLFGQTEGYTISASSLRGGNELVGLTEGLLKNAQDIRQRLTKRMEIESNRLSAAPYLLDALRLGKDPSAVKITVPEDFLLKPGVPRWRCSGCGACANACTAGCLAMKPSDDGFLFPQLDSSDCTSCGKCSDVCPVKKAQPDNKKPIAYAARSRDATVRMKSSSGGVFSLIASAVLERGGVVFGAEYGGELNVRHISVADSEGLGILRGAKYPQSDTGNTFQEAKALLDKGREVLFSGTPCQISGFKSYLGKDYPLLTCVDIICHGVASPKAWQEYLTVRGRDLGALRDINLRDKTNGWPDYAVSINSGAYLTGKDSDPFMSAYLARLLMRESCHQCHFKTAARVSDITLADFWGVNKVCPAMHDGKGTSLVLLHSEKGKKIFGNASPLMDCVETDTGNALKFNTSAIHSTPMPSNRSEFIKNLGHEPFDALVARLKPPAVKRSLPRRILSRLLKR